MRLLILVFISRKTVNGKVEGSDGGIRSSVNVVARGLEEGSYVYIDRIMVSLGSGINLQLPLRGFSSTPCPTVMHDTM